MKRQVFVLIALTVLLTTSACGGTTPSEVGNSIESVSQPSADAALSIVSDSISKTVVLTKSAPVIVDPATLDLGLQIYNKRKCSTCHGENGEGVEGKGKAMAGDALNEVDFTDFLRTGGTVGNDHLFGPNQISPTGMNALYAYVASLK